MCIYIYIYIYIYTYTYTYTYKFVYIYIYIFSYLVKGPLELDPLSQETFFICNFHDFLKFYLKLYLLTLSLTEIYL